MQVWKMAERGMQFGKEAAEKKLHVLKEIVKIRNEVSVCREVADRNYMEIGKAYYEAHRYEEADQYRKQICAITNAENGAADLEKKGRSLKEKML